jgi:hypothetical protein
MEALCWSMNAVTVVITTVEAEILLMLFGPCNNISPLSALQGKAVLVQTNSMKKKYSCYITDYLQIGLLLLTD